MIANTIVIAMMRNSQYARLVMAFLTPAAHALALILILVVVVALALALVLVLVRGNSWWLVAMMTWLAI